jgi:signal transduction histidine kinase
MPFWLHESFFATLAAGFMCVYALIRDIRDPRNRAFAGYAATIACISFASLVIFHAPDFETAERWQRITCWSFMYIPHFLLAFCLHLVGTPARPRRWLLIGSASICTGFAALTFSPWFVLGYVRDGPYIKPEYGPAYLAFVLYVIVVFVGSIATMIALARRRDAYLRHRIELFLFGLGVSMGLAILSFFLMHVVQYPLTTIGYLVGMGFMAYAFMTDRLWGMGGFLRLLGAYLTLGAVMVLPFYALLLLAIHVTAGGVHPALGVLLLATLLGLMWISQGLGTRVRSAMDRAVPWQDRARRALLMNAAKELVGLPTVEAVGAQLSALVVDNLGASWAGLYLDRNDRLGLRLLDTSGTFLGVPTHISSELAGIRWLQRRGRPVLTTPLRGAPSNSEARALAELLEDWGAEIALPIQVDAEARSLLLIGGSRDDSIYEPPILDALEALCATIGDALRSAAAFQREHIDLQIDHISQWAGVLAEEIEDSVVPVRELFERGPEATEQPSLPEGLDETMRRQLDRALGLVSELQQLRVERRPRRRRDDLARIVRACVDGIGQAPGRAEPRIELQLERDSLPGRFDPEQLELALTNLLDSALFHAEQAPVRLTLATTEPGDAGGRLASLFVWYDAVIEPWHLPRVFTPSFAPTRGAARERGFGLNLPIAQRVIRAHGGNISVTSHAAAGTTFVVSLPLEEDEE